MLINEDSGTLPYSPLPTCMSSSVFAALGAPIACIHLYGEAPQAGITICLFLLRPGHGDL